MAIELNTYKVSYRMQADGISLVVARSEAAAEAHVHKEMSQGTYLFADHSVEVLEVEKVSRQAGRDRTLP